MRFNWFRCGPSKQELMDVLLAQNEQIETLKQFIDARIWKSEEQTAFRLDELSKTIDARIWKSEEQAASLTEELSKTIDARIWKSEEQAVSLTEELSKTIDARIWKSEEQAASLTEELSKTIDARIWKSEVQATSLTEELSKTIDARIWKSEMQATSLTEELSKAIDARIWKSEEYLDNQIMVAHKEFHRHIDFTYRDLMVAMERQIPFLPKSDIKLETAFPIAYESLDHLYPHGTIRDNTRYPRFVEKCEELLKGKKELSFLDLGCSGGGMVLEAALRGHLSIGLEGSDCSLKEQRAEWRLLGERLQTCDITKPFSLKKAEGQLQQFDIITAWEVLEHIAEDALPHLFENIKKHLTQNGYFIASISNWDDIDPVSGVNWHVTVHPYQWWKERLETAGFMVCTELLQPIDLARGGYNPPHCYESPHIEIDETKTFHIVVRTGS